MDKTYLSYLFSLAGHTALVTGSSRGIGKSIAMALGRAGAKIILHGASDSETLRATLADAIREGIAAEARPADLGDIVQCERLAADCADADILVINASAQEYGHLMDFNDKAFRRMTDTNIGASFRLLKAFGPRMATKGWGRIISIGSINAAHPAPRLAIYASTKAAQKAMMLTAAQEWAANGVTVNTISPGVIATDRNAQALTNPQFAESLRSRIPAARFGTAEDCAGIVVALCSDACSYITGADIPVDGGFGL